MTNREFKLALGMLREDPAFLEDARIGGPVGNSVVGSLLSSFHGVPRQYAEQAVCQAVQQLDAEAYAAQTAEVADAQADDE